MDSGEVLLPRDLVGFIRIIYRDKWEGARKKAHCLGKQKIGKFTRTNGGTSRVHGVRQATCFHEALDCSDLRGDGCGWGANLFYSQLRV